MTMNSQLTAIIVHDLKNALGTLEGQLSALTVDLERERAVSAHTTCVALREKLIGFLTLYKAAEQGLVARIEAVSPDDFLQALVRNHPTVNSAERPQIQITINDDAMPAMGFFDEHLTGMALDAALQNALRFAKSEISIACVKTDGDIIFTIKDDGPGLGTTEDKPSTGLGLALCEAIARAHQNEGRYGSTGLQSLPDGGALFTLRLP
jgi:signal transduction histidine kinase